MDGARQGLGPGPGAVALAVARPPTRARPAPVFLLLLLPLFHTSRSKSLEHITWVQLMSVLCSCRANRLPDIFCASLSPRASKLYADRSTLWTSV